MQTRRSSHVHALSAEDFLGTNFLELRKPEVQLRRILLPHTLVNKGMSKCKRKAGVP